MSISFPPNISHLYRFVFLCSPLRSFSVTFGRLLSAKCEETCTALKCYRRFPLHEVQNRTTQCCAASVAIVATKMPSWSWLSDENGERRKAATENSSRRANTMARSAARDGALRGGQRKENYAAFLFSFALHYFHASSCAGGHRRSNEKLKNFVQRNEIECGGDTFNR